MAHAADARPANRSLYAATAMLLAVSVGVQAIRDRGWAPYVPPNPIMWVHSGPMAKRLVLGFDNLIADAYWLRTVVYYGGKRRDRENGPPQSLSRTDYALLYPLLDLVTTLDPHFKMAYRFGAIFLTEAYPNGPGRPDLAIELLKRGIEQDPTRWEYMEDIGFVYYWWLRDFSQAAAWFKRAGELPGAPRWLPSLAATTLAQGGDRASARFLWTQILTNSDLDWLRRTASHSLQQLDAMDTIDELNRRSARFVAREHRPPRDWREFATAERLRAIPVDPAGVPYALDPATGKIDIDRQSPLWPLPWEQGLPTKQAS